MINTARFVRRLDGFKGDARLFALSEPILLEDGDNYTQTSHVVVSRTMVTFSGWETYIFAASPEGSVLDFGELDGSTRGECSHEDALRSGGWTVT